MRSVAKVMPAIIAVALSGCSDAMNLSNFAFKNQKAQAAKVGLGAG